MKLKKIIMFLTLMIISLSLIGQEKKKGTASFYHKKFNGRITANGEIFDNSKYTAASNVIKIGSYIKVTNISNGTFVYVKINDKMSKTNQRLIDLASIAADKLGFKEKGITKVKVEMVSEEEGKINILAQSEIKIEKVENEL